MVEEGWKQKASVMAVKAEEQAFKGQSTKPDISLEENREPEQNEANENPNPEALKYFMNGQMRNI